MKEALTLLELNQAVRLVVEQTMDDVYWLRAELSEVRESYQGHCYLEFIQKEESNGQLVAKARGVIWAATYRSLRMRFEHETGQCLVAGIQVLVCVRICFHELYGYSLSVCDIDPAYTLGDMARRRREILERLRREGVLEDNKSLVMPLLPNRVAVISSATAAGYEDFCDQLLHNDSGFRFHIKLFPAVMQGERVEETVMDALGRIMQEVDSWDVVVIIRGGGAASDLSGFDSYMLAAACAQFPLPIITGIGHERDDTVLDEVAHTRVKTPTAAAACLLAYMMQASANLNQLQDGILAGISNRVLREQLRISQMAGRLPVAFGAVKIRAGKQLDIKKHTLQMQLKMRLQNETYSLKHREQQLDNGVKRRIEQECAHLDSLEKQIQAWDPERLLKLGGTLTYHNGRLVCCAKQLKAGDRIETRFSDGAVISEII